MPFRGRPTLKCRHGRPFCHPSSGRVLLLFSSGCFLLADGPGSRDVIDLMDRSSSLLDLARGYAHAREAKGWGWAPGFGRLAPVRATFMAEMQAYDSCVLFNEEYSRTGRWSTADQSHRCTAVRNISASSDMQNHLQDHDSA